MGYFTIFEGKLHSANIKDHQSWAFSETVQKISKITYTAIGFSLLSNFQCELWKNVWMFWTNINRVTLQHNKELIMFIFFLFHGFITMCNLKKRLIHEAFWVLLRAMFMTDWKQTAQRLTLQVTTNNQYNKLNSVKHLQRQQFLFTKTSIKVSLKILSLWFMF